MIRSLRARLMGGMLLGMAVLLAIASAAVYAVQRQQLYQAFDDTLVNSANSLAVLIHPGPAGYWFDPEAPTRLPAGQLRPGAVFQLWSDQPIDILPPRLEPDDSPVDSGAPGPPLGDRPPSPAFTGPDAPSGAPPPPRPPEPLEGPWWRPQGELVVRSPLLNGADLPRLEAREGRSRFQNITMPDGASGRAVGFQFQMPRRGFGPAGQTR